MTVLALDMGSSSVRAAICDDDANPIDGRLTRREFRATQQESGAGVIDPDVYVANVVACIDELSDAGALSGLEAVAISSQWHSVLPVDPDSGRPRAQVLTWLDTRAEPRRWPDDPEAFHARTGAWQHTLYWTAKLPWLRERRPGPIRFVGLPDYVRRILLGSDDTSVSLASGTGMLNHRENDWDAEALRLAGAERSELPVIDDTPRTLVGRWRDRWPELADVPWHPAVGDGAASNLGSGAGEPGTAAITVGTSLALRVVHTEDTALPAEVWRYRVDSDRYVSGIAFSGGGVLYAWLTRMLKLDKRAGEPSGVPPGGSGLLVLPMHAGSRPPGTLPGGSGAMLGVSLDTSEQELIAGTLDGVSLTAANALETLEAMTGQQLRVALGGGAAYASAWWRRSLAAATEHEMHVVSDPEVGVRGAAAIALGLVPSCPETVVHPDAEDVRRFAGQRARQRYLLDFVATDAAAAGRAEAERAAEQTVAEQVAGSPKRPEGSAGRTDP